MIPFLEINGDIHFIHADGEKTDSANTYNFDSVNEKVELTLTQGKAFVIIKVRMCRPIIDKRLIGSRILSMEIIN
jgi:hypothetical protein